MNKPFQTGGRLLYGRNPAPHKTYGRFYYRSKTTVFCLLSSCYFISRPVSFLTPVFIFIIPNQFPPVVSCGLLQLPTACIYKKRYTIMLLHDRNTYVWSRQSEYCIHMPQLVISCGWATSDTPVRGVGILTTTSHPKSAMSTSGGDNLSDAFHSSVCKWARLMCSSNAGSVGGRLMIFGVASY